MENTLEASKALLEIVPKLISKIKELRSEKEALESSTEGYILTEDQKTEIMNLLEETKAVLEA